MMLLLAAGCARQPLHVHTDIAVVAQYEYLMQALAADAPAREALWQDLQLQSEGRHKALRQALLRSVPGHTGHDLAAAESELQAFLAQGPQSGLAPVAKARLEDVRAQRACRIEVESVKRRLSKVADIERRQDQNRR